MEYLGRVKLFLLREVVIGTFQDYLLTQMEINEDIFDKIVVVNQKGTLFCTQEVAREMIKKRKG